MTEKYCVELLYPPNNASKPDAAEEVSAVAGPPTCFSLSDVATKYNLPRLAHALHTYYTDRDEHTLPIEDLIANTFKSMRVLRSFLPVKYEESLSSLRCVADESYYGVERFDHIQIADEGVATLWTSSTLPMCAFTTLLNVVIHFFTCLW